MWGGLRGWSNKFSQGDFMIATINWSYAYRSLRGVWLLDLLWDGSYCLYALIGLVTISFIRFTCSFGQRSCDARKQQDIIILLITCAKYISAYTLWFQTTILPSTFVDRDFMTSSIYGYFSNFSCVFAVAKWIRGNTRCDSYIREQLFVFIYWVSN